MALQIISVAWIVLPCLLLISKSNSQPAKLTIWQDLRDDGDQEIIFIILHALSPRHDGTGANKQRPGNYQMKGIGWEHKNALVRGGGGIEAPTFEEGRERRQNGNGLA